MINITEYRIGNALLQKTGPKIAMQKCTVEHYAIIARGEGALLFPVVLKPELFERYGFVENKDYPLYPQAREFRLTLPVKSDAEHQILGYMKNNSECFARAAVNGVAASNNVHQLHQLQNLYYALTGLEMAGN